MEKAEETLDWKEVGNRAFQEKKYEEAIDAYGQGLKVTPSDVTLLSNRAINYLHLQLYSLALSDCENVLKLEPTHAKAIYRKVKALIGGRKYREAAEFIVKDDNLRILNSHEKDLGQKVLNETLKFLEQERGKYNMAEILREQSFLHEVADFHGPVTLELFEGRGRGLVVTQNVEAGQLLIGSKAYAFIVERKYRPLKKSATPPESSEPPVDYSIKREEAQASLVKAVADKIQKSPEETRVMYNLHAGEKLGQLELDESLNYADLDRIRKIVDCNALIADGRLKYEFKELMCGLWLLPSFINHSCFDVNVKWHMHGDFLAIIAIKDIPVGTELRMSYISPAESLESRDELLRNYEVRCDCSLCCFQRQEMPMKQERLDSALKRYEEYISKPGSMVSTETSELESIVKELEALYPGQLSLCPFLISPYKVLARRYFRKEKYDESIETLEKGRRLIVGTDFTDHLLTFTTNIISAHLKNKNKSKAIEWVKTLRSDIKICYGEPISEVLHVVAPDLLAKLKQEKIEIEHK